MIDDTRGAVWNVSTELILDAENNVGTDAQGYPRFIYYIVPSLKINKSRKVLLEESDISTLRDQVNNNANVFTGSNILKGFSNSSNAIFIGGKAYYPATLNYVDYPQEDFSWSPPPEERVEQVLTTVVGYDSAQLPFSAGDYKGKKVTLRRTVKNSEPIQKQGLVGGKIYTRVTPSNIRNINGVLYRDEVIEWREF